MKGTADDVDAYVAKVAIAMRPALDDLRARLLATIPQPTEGFSYGVPAVAYRGVPVACYAAAKEHLSLFPMGSALIEKYAEQLMDFSTSRGTIRFTPDHPLPVRLIDSIVRDRLAMIDAKQGQGRS